MIQRAPAARWSTTRLALISLLLYLGVASAGPSRPPDSVTPCIPCHNRAGNDQVGEWLASPYSHVAGGRGCTGCHRRPCSGADPTGARNRHVTDGLSRAPEVAARLTVTAVCSADGVDAEVVVTNLGAGHDLPTGPAGRTLVLEVTAHGKDGTGLPPRVRSEGSTHAPELAGSSGRIFIKHPPAGGSETYRSRLAPFETDVSHYRFRFTERDPALVKARLLLSEPRGAPLEIASAASICRWSSAEGKASP